jgi:hypothetical protein
MKVGNYTELMNIIKDQQENSNSENKVESAFKEVISRFLHKTQNDEPVIADAEQESVVEMIVKLNTNENFVDNF